MTHVEVHRSVCQGYGHCVTAAPRNFSLDEGGRAVVTSAQVAPDEAADVDFAAAMCPIGAIEVR